MNPVRMHSNCQDGEGCHGPGCRVSTGKTQRKENYRRPKPNQHEASRETPTKAKKAKADA